MIAKKKPVIEITIGTKGEVTVTVDGCTGKACEVLTRDLERELGRTTANRRTAAYYDTEKDLKVRQ